MRAKVFTLENELDRLKVEVSEKDQLSEQVHCQLFYSSSGSFIISPYTFCKGFKNPARQKFPSSLSAWCATRGGLCLAG